MTTTNAYAVRPIGRNREPDSNGLKPALHAAGKIPWFAMFIIGAAFFATLHSVAHTSFFIQHGLEEGFGFIPTDEEVQQLVAGWETGKMKSAVAYLSLGALGVLGFAFKARNRLRFNGALAMMVFIYAFWAYASSIWAEDHFLTIKSLIIFSMCCVSLVYVARRFSGRDIVTLTDAVMGAYLVIGLLSEIAYGTFHPWMAGYRFSGTCHPNGQALDDAMLFIALVFMGRTKPERRNYLLLALIVLLFLVLTKSRTSILAAVMSPLIYLTLNAQHAKQVAFGLLLAFGACMLMFLQPVIAPVFQKAAVMGRADTNIEQVTKLTGRVDLWNYLGANYIAERPVLGYGFNSFWTAKHVEDVADQVDFMATTAHSIYVDLLLGLGPVGFLAFVLAHLLAIRKTMHCYAQTHSRTHAFFGSMLIFILLNGFTESGFLFMGTSTFIGMAIITYLAFHGGPVEQRLITNEHQ